MKQTHQIPTVDQLEKAYELLMYSTNWAENAQQLIKFCIWSRTDPRLAEILVNFISRKWKTLDPTAIQRAATSESKGNSLGVILEFVQELIKAGKRREEYTHFKLWKALACYQLNKAQNENYFVGLRQLGGHELLEDVRHSIIQYQRWGYFGRENLVNKKDVGLLSPETRQQILEDLIKKNSRIRTRDYWEALSKRVSKRQAERDLLECPYLEPKGKTKDRYFLVSKPFC